MERIEEGNDCPVGQVGIGCHGLFDTQGHALLVRLVVGILSRDADERSLRLGRESQIRAKSRCTIEVCRG